jgi:hypothetical protein
MKIKTFGLLAGHSGIGSADQNVTTKGNQFCGLSLLVYGLTQPVGIRFACFLPPRVVSGNTFVGLPPLADAPCGASLQGAAGTYFGLQPIESLCQ